MDHIDYRQSMIQSEGRNQEEANEENFGDNFGSTDHNVIFVAKPAMNSYLEQRLALAAVANQQTTATNDALRNNRLLASALSIDHDTLMAQYQQQLKQNEAINLRLFPMANSSSSSSSSYSTQCNNTDTTANNTITTTTITTPLPFHQQTILTKPVILDHIRNSFDYHTKVPVKERRDDKRRATHNEVERRRRDKINTFIMRLAKIIPHCSDDNSKYGQSKGGILAKAYDHILELNKTKHGLNEMIRQNQILLSELEDMKSKNAQLVLELTRLQKEVVIKGGQAEQEQKARDAQ